MAPLKEWEEKTLGQFTQKNKTKTNKQIFEKRKKQQ